MHRQLSLLFAICLIATLTTFAAAADKPNIIFLMADDKY